MNRFFMIIMLLAFSGPLFATDHHDFLLKRHPELVPMSEQPFVLRDYNDEFERRRKLDPDLRKLTDEQVFTDISLFNGVEVRDEHFVNPKIFKAEQEMLQLKKAKLGALSSFYKLFFSRKLLPCESFTPLEDMVLAAEEIHYLIQQKHYKPEDRAAIVFLGRTPCIIQLIMEMIQMKNPGDNCLPLIHVNYSGHPDAYTMREDEDFQTVQNTAMNIVTPKKLQFYLDYLYFKKLQCYKNIILVDMIGKGGGLNSWLRLLKTACKNMGYGLCMPNVHFMALGPTVMPDGLNAGVWQFDHGVLRFKADKQKNIHPFEINATFIHVGAVTMEYILDDDFIQRFGVHGYYFPPQMWVEDRWAEVVQGGAYHKALYRNLLPKIDLILRYHTQEIRKIEQGKW